MPYTLGKRTGGAAEAKYTLRAPARSGTAVASESFKANMAGANRLIRYMDNETFTTFFRETYELNGELMREAGLSN